MKVLFAVPPSRDEKRPGFIAPSLGLLYLAGAAVEAGFEVELIDALAENLSWRDFEKRATESDADIVALTGMSPTWDITCRAAGIFKAAGKFVIVGGPYVTMRADSFFDVEKDIATDVAVVGEGEITFVELLKAIDACGDLADINGVVTPTGAGPTRELIENLDDLPFPARSLLNTNLYSYPPLGPGPASTIFTSRGCPHSCVFCDKSVFGSKPRLHSPDRVVRELKEIVCDQRVKNVIIYDDLFTIDRDRVIEICRRIVDSDLRFRWKCEARADNVDSEMLEWMRKAGCRIVAYGIETVNKHGLNFLRKGATKYDAVCAVDITRRAGMEVLAYFLVGIPGETIEDVRETARFAARWGVSWAQFSVLSPLEGTPLCDMAQREGWYALVDATNPFDADLSRPALLDGYWDAERLRRALYVAHRTFYGRPYYVWTRLKRAGGLRAAMGMLGRGMELIGWMRKIKA